jgi:RNA polymerase sigma factor (TIGR02999 family)
VNDVTQILAAIEAGDPHAASQLLPLVYDELRRLAAQKMLQEKPGQTLQATALVNEAYLRLVASPGRQSGESGQHWDNRGHFFAAAAEAMRRIVSLRDCSSSPRASTPMLAPIRVSSYLRRLTW